MKRIGIFLLFQFFVSVHVYGQDNGGGSSQQVPLATQIQIGFMFVYAVLGLLFLMLFAFYPRQRLNLFFGLFSLLLFLESLNSQLVLGESPALRGHATGFISRLIGMNILLFILHALGRMRPFFWWFIAFVLFVDFPLSLILGDRYVFINQIVRSVFTIICAWLAFASFSTKKREDWLIGIIAASSFFINFGQFMLYFVKIDLRRYTVLVPVVNTVAALCYLALRYSRANTSLERQLVQVKNLSEENVRREQEKQQLLATQNEMLEQQVKQRTAEITSQKEMIEHTLEELRLTQTQLIQSEKMASLGELTGGIAHEIQNPLNFVNNFSDVNKDLLTELKEEIDKNNFSQVKSIADDVIDNEKKINHHGKRAEAIVKGMLQHSRVSTGQKEPTDINALCDEYLRLAYHGMRAKDSSFNATVKTDFDSTIGKINLVSQEIGRVLLNLVNNAFYAVHERTKLNQAGYAPAVSLATGKVENKIEIKVTDNGMGIPEKILDKIYQPFFTTKPTGQGTGLGLSLAYDIMKANGGEIKVATKEGEFTQFKVYLAL